MGATLQRPPPLADPQTNILGTLKHESVSRQPSCAPTQLSSLKALFADQFIFHSDPPPLLSPLNTVIFLVHPNFSTVCQWLYIKLLTLTLPLSTLL